MKLTISVLFFVLATIIGISVAEKARFDNYRVYSLSVDSEEQLQFLHDLEANSGSYLLWNSVQLNGLTDIMVPPHKLGEFNELIVALKFTTSLKIDNVQTLVDNERPKIKPRAFDWTDYSTYDEIYAWIDQQLAAHPTVLTNHVVGTSYQGRLIRAVKLSHKAGNPAIFIEANIHAREWITSATATWWLNELLTSTEPEIVDLAQNIDWYIVPIFNVDGFVYSHTTNRMWRKTRYPHAHICYGADANRNFDFQWMVNSGADQNPCSELYAGPAPFSEIETKSLASFITSDSNSVKVYISFHSYGQYILFPYGHSLGNSPHHENLSRVGEAVGAAFAKYNGTEYVVGTTGQALYIASGTSPDWAYATQNIFFAYTFEFRDHRNGNHGFILPADQIIPNALEAKDGILALVKEVRALGQL